MGAHEAVVIRINRWRHTWWGGGNRSRCIHSLPHQKVPDDLYCSGSQLLFPVNMASGVLPFNCVALNPVTRSRGIHSLINRNLAVSAASSSRIVGVRSDIADAVKRCLGFGMLAEKEKDILAPIIGRM